MIRYTLTFILVSSLTWCHANPFDYLGQTTVGDSRNIFPFMGQSLYQIGREHNLGPHEMERANKRLRDTWFLYPWQMIFIPGELEVPGIIHQHRRLLFVDLSTHRLFARFDDVLVTYPVGIGKEHTPTPIGEFTITHKRVDPVWRPPESVRQEQEALGNPLEKVVPPGPDNPLGTRGIYFNEPGYLIHGTNYPGGVGRSSSAGCVRMNNEDVEALYEFVQSGDKLIIIEGVIHDEDLSKD